MADGLLGTIGRNNAWDGGGGQQDGGCPRGLPAAPAQQVMYRENVVERILLSLDQMHSQVCLDPWPPGMTLKSPA